ncbi:putative Glyoxalase/Bleomycin resistance protein/Dihydroxybiphenyl dioxygenase [Vibrio nigripulchritudo SO65]|uniref:VOC family protein n=1 Tax=Vibrio nigripulchritudo TaxID=28173 RepID=UPI0003B1AC55|nr:VOC family protein [Vibrio nigripulchritudo]CCN33103.1 putative Glyoxalase/Bleomycin resistance protein/Dihydroxybiphenyl dioxygenase [Vibrio nigripulchritudo AM115]CCN41208.1 putative Glyoxalase/Bleomycin resistance protein/Dihydroxybiphenyl dioxygenase [Vibrio nigripulchritudo FTn2]CCN67980.1 putative Glyoxalase/Bleomycin resistance protein/Dihydroxybiphenyl dioxygenase [Vibrio nigripulchritudo POn4]CCN78266.1 putative Glyoxalase/Bleomycin resistance protein/Dihydroxybiphenyl dioxygenase [
MSNNHLGIDHPLVAVKDMDKVSDDFARLGFYINPRHHHPWGTDNHLLMFPDNFIELISIYDHSKLDMKNERGFAFGRFISDSIERREGISLVALHSEDARQDHQLMEERGVENNGIVDFRRVAHRPDGTEEEAIVSLVMLINSKTPSISHFFCHQHKPELVWVEDWMNHPNGANGITSVSYIASDPADLEARFKGIYGEEAVTLEEGYLNVQTDRGIFEVLSPERARRRFEGVALPCKESELPTGVAIRVSSHSVQKAMQHLDSNGVTYVQTEEGGVRIPAKFAGNTIIEIYPEEER